MAARRTANFCATFTSIKRSLCRCPPIYLAGTVFVCSYPPVASDESVDPSTDPVSSSNFSAPFQRLGTPTEDYEDSNSLSRLSSLFLGPRPLLAVKKNRMEWKNLCLLEMINSSSSKIGASIFETFKKELYLKG